VAGDELVTIWATAIVWGYPLIAKYRCRCVIGPIVWCRYRDGSQIGTIVAMIPIVPASPVGIGILSE
jgi:hypothetical protein